MKDFKLCMNQSDVSALPMVRAIMAENEATGPITEERWNVVKGQIEKDMDEFSQNVRTKFIAKALYPHLTTCIPTPQRQDHHPTFILISSSRLPLSFSMLLVINACVNTRRYFHTAMVGVAR